jgi:RHS repeat-associated protein
MRIAMHLHPVRPVLASAIRVLFVALAMPACLSAWSQVPGNPYAYSRTATLGYDAQTGLLNRATLEPDNPLACIESTYRYDSFGNAVGGTTANCAGAPASVRFSPQGGSVSYAQGLFPTHTENALGHAEDRQFDPRFGAVVKVTGPNLIDTSWVLDDFGRKVKVMLADGTSVVTAYCVLPGGGRDTSSNTAGCPTPAAGEAPPDATAFVEGRTLDATGAVMGAFVRSYTDRLGRTIRVATESFDGPAQPAGRSAALLVQDTVYSVQGVVTVRTQPYFLASGSSTTQGANDVGVTRFDHDILGRPVTVDVADPKGLAGVQPFGAYGAKTAARTRYQYAGLATTITNDKGQTRLEEMNAIGEPVRVTDAAGAQLAYQRDAFGNLLATKDALQNLVTQQHDIRGRRVQMNDPDAGVWSFCYDALGQLTAQQSSNMRGGNVPGACPANANDGAGVANSLSGWTTFAYDVLGRTTQRVEPEFKSTWSYDRYADGSVCGKGTGKLCEESTTHGMGRKLVYDALGRPINQLTSTGTGPSFATAVAYDAITGLVSRETYPTGLQVGYGYTARGYLERMTLLTAATVTPLPATPGGTPASSLALPANSLLWQAQAINAWGALEQQGYGNGVIGRAAYEAATGRATDVTAGLAGTTQALNHHYTWDSLDNLTARADANGDGGSGAVTETFSYDAQLNRLTSYTVAAPAIANLSRTVNLQYNALGLLLYKSDAGAYAYPAQGAGSVRPHAVATVTAATTMSRGYDANGNLVSASDGKYRSVSYTSFDLPDGQGGLSGAPGGPQYTWVYDASHGRVKEVRRVNGGAQAGTRTTWYLHPDNAGGLGFESEQNSPDSPSAANPAGTSHRHFLQAGGVAVGVLVSTGALPTLATGQTVPPALGSVTLRRVEYWHRDHLGSVASTTDERGGVTARYAYDPFGKRRYTNGNLDAAGNLVVQWSNTSSGGTARGFTGHEHLDDVGVVHMNGRLFDAALGVFLQADAHVPDPGNLQSFNRYGYCLNNPLGCTDPSGFTNGKNNKNAKDLGGTGFGFGWTAYYPTAGGWSTSGNGSAGTGSNGGGGGSSGKWEAPPGIQVASSDDGLPQVVSDRWTQDENGTNWITGCKTACAPLAIPPRNSWQPNSPFGPNPPRDSGVTFGGVSAPSKAAGAPDGSTAKKNLGPRITTASAGFGAAANINVQQINRSWDRAVAANDLAGMEAAFGRYQALAGDGPSSAMQIVAWGSVLTRTLSDAGAGPNERQTSAIVVAGIQMAITGSRVGGKGTAGAAGETRFINGVAVTDRKTGNVFQGTVDLKPTLDRISSGKSFPHKNDGSVFSNKEGLLPQQSVGYYREYVHATPGVNGAGPQRIVTGKGGEVFYTPDHYGTFIRLNP